MAGEPSRLQKHLPAWILPHLEIYRPVLLELQQQIAALTAQLEAAAPAQIPAGMGKLTTVVVSREICDWERFKNRRTIQQLHRTVLARPPTSLVLRPS